MLFMFQHISQYKNILKQNAESRMLEVTLKWLHIFFSIILNICFISVFSIPPNITDTISPKNQIF